MLMYLYMYLFEFNENPLNHSSINNWDYEPFEKDIILMKRKVGRICLFAFSIDSKTRERCTCILHYKQVTSQMLNGILKCAGNQK